MNHDQRAGSGSSLRTVGDIKAVYAPEFGALKARIGENLKNGVDTLKNIRRKFPEIFPTSASDLDITLDSFDAIQRIIDVFINKHGG